MSYWITQYYLPPDRGDVPAITPVEAGTSRLMRISFSRIFRGDQCVAAGLEPLRLEPADMSSLADTRTDGRADHSITMKVVNTVAIARAMKSRSGEAPLPPTPLFLYKTWNDVDYHD